MDKPIPYSMINTARIPVAGIGGLGMVALAVAIAGELTAARQLLVGGFAAGFVMGIVLIVARRRQPLTEGTGPGSTMLFPHNVAVREGVTLERPDPAVDPRQQVALA